MTVLMKQISFSCFNKIICFIFTLLSNKRFSIRLLLTKGEFFPCGKCIYALMCISSRVKALMALSIFDKMKYSLSSKRNKKINK